MRPATPPERTIETTHIAIWLAIGAALGALAAQFKPSVDRVTFIETLAVGIFGSFLGGEFVAAMFRSDPKADTLTVSTVGLAVGCSVAALIVLGVMRRAVGPLRAGKSKQRR